MAFDVGAKKGAVTPAINVTPLVDVVLVLLIIFMVITPMLTKQMWVQVPEKQKDQKVAPLPDDGQPPVTLRLELGGKMYVGPDLVSKADLKTKLKRVFAARSDRLLFFDADDNVTHGEALAALDLARASGPWTLIILPEPLPK